MYYLSAFPRFICAALLLMGMSVVSTFAQQSDGLAKSLERVETEIEAAMEKLSIVMEKFSEEHAAAFEGEWERSFEGFEEKMEAMGEQFEKMGEQFEFHAEEWEEQMEHISEEVEAAMEKHGEAFEKLEEEMKAFEKQIRSIEKELKQELLKDGFIDSLDDEIQINNTKKGIEINGKLLEGKQAEKYESLLKKFHLGEEGDFWLKK